MGFAGLGQDTGQEMKRVCVLFGAVKAKMSNFGGVTAKTSSLGVRNKMCFGEPREAAQRSAAPRCPVLLVS